MKSHFNLIVTILAACAFLTACSSQDLATAAVDNNSNPGVSRYRIGVDPNLDPFESVDAATKSLTGFDIELIKEIAKAAEIDVELIVVGTGYGQLISDISTCKLDGGISAIAITPQLEKQMLFSAPYYTTGQVIVVKKSNIKITSQDTLGNMVVGTLQNSPSQFSLESIIGTQSMLYDDFYFAYQELIRANIDAVISDKPRGLFYTKIKPNNLKIIETDFEKVNFGIAVCKNQADLNQKINAGLEKLKTNGVLNRLTKKWIVEEGQ